MDNRPMEAYFNDTARTLDHLVRGRERCLFAFQGEDGAFCRFNQGKVRQAGHVRQMGATLTLIDGRRQARHSLRLCGDPETDRDRLAAVLERLRTALPALPEDPYLLFAEEVRATRRADAAHPPDPLAIAEEVVTAAAGHDLVGLLASGTQYAGFANTLGQRNWHAVAGFNLEWSLYAGGDKAVKRLYAGAGWDGDAFRARLEASAVQLEVMRRPPVTLPPGEYRVYLAPAALSEVVEMLGWGGFSARAHATKTSPLHRLAAGAERLDPRVSLTEATAHGLAPGFQEHGFVRPERVELVAAGRYREHLVSPRSAAEYGLDGNGADAGESPLSIDMAAGDLPAAEALSRLGDGLYINNLWYLNWSDRNSARLTGMTRFASFRVEGGEVRAPIQVLRFDDSVYRLLGSQLEALTAERELVVDNSSYEARSFRSVRLPGALLEGMRFTL